MTGVLELAKVHKGDFRITANQNLIVANVAEQNKAQIESIARQYGLIQDKKSQNCVKTQCLAYLCRLARWQWLKQNGCCQTLLVNLIKC